MEFLFENKSIISFKHEEILIIINKQKYAHKIMHNDIIGYFYSEDGISREVERGSFLEEKVTEWLHE